MYTLYIEFSIVATAVRVLCMAYYNIFVCLPIEQARPVSRARAHVGRAGLVSQNRVQSVQRLEYSLVPAAPFDQFV